MEQKRVAKFERVTIDEFKRAFMMYGHGCISEEAVQCRYKNICIPERKTKLSAGYDFCSTLNVELQPSQSIVIPTGIKCKMLENYMLQMFPRSGLGVKYHCMLLNTVGIIDADYYGNADNEGHILVFLVNMGDKTINIEEGDRISQGIFLEFGITTTDKTNGIRVGGFGSTGR